MSPTPESQLPIRIGEDMKSLMTRLYPICRSITGNGVRETLEIMSEVIPIESTEIPSGTAVFDWTIPDEWNIRAAYIDDPDGNRIVDFADHSLHVMSYSTPVDQVLELSELKKHLYSDPARPDAIPYRTSYYNASWGFCLPHHQLESLPDGDYHAFIDADLQPGSLTIGEHVIEGRLQDEILIYSHTCHPSLANDNLSGLVVNSYLAKWLSGQKPRFTYRFVFAPGTIGSIAWLSANQDRLSQIRYGLVAVLLGGPGEFTFKQTRNLGDELNQVVEATFENAGISLRTDPFSPYGYDERQFGSPGIGIPVGRLTRAPNNEFAEYHSSDDNLDFVSEASLEESYAIIQKLFSAFEEARFFENTAPMCEPQLGRRGLYGKVGGKHVGDRELAILWLLNQSDGSRSIQDISRRSGVSLDSLLATAEELVDAGLLRELFV